MLVSNIIGIGVGFLAVVGGIFAYNSFVAQGFPMWTKIMGLCVVGMGALTIYEYYIREQFYTNL